MRSERSIESEFCGWSDTYDRPELVLSLIAIVTGHYLSYVKGTGRPVFCIVKRAWCRGILSQWFCTGSQFSHLSRISLPDVTQPWYADESGALGTFARIETYFDSPTRQCPERGYYPKQFKSVLIVHPENLESGKELWARHGFKMYTGPRYLGGYIGDDETKTIVWESVRWRGRKTSTRSEKPQGNTPRRFTPQ